MTDENDKKEEEQRKATSFWRRWLGPSDEWSDREETESLSERLGSLFQHVLDGILVLDFKGKVLFCNNAAARMFGFETIEECLGRNALDFVTREYRSRVIRDQAAVLLGKEGFLSQYRAVRSNGEEFWIEGLGNKTHFDGKEINLVTIRDVSERMNLEQKVRVSEEKHRSILDGIEEAYFEVDLRGNITYVNRAALAMTGYTAEELLGMSNRTYSTPGTAKKMLLIFQRIHETGQPTEITDFEIIRKDGAKRILEVSASLIRNDPGEPIGFRGIARDVTERNREREAWRQYEFIVNAAKDLMTLVNRGYEYEAVNEAYAKAHRLKREDIMGRTVSEIWGKTSFTGIIRPYMDRCFLGEEINYQAWFEFPALGLRYFDVTYYPYRNRGNVITHAVVVSHDMTEHRKAEETLKRSLDELARTLEETVESLASALEVRDPYTAGHQRRVALLGCAIATEMGLEESEVHAIRLASLVHDVGKINVPTEILTKPGRLTQIEMNMIKLHSQVGHDILKNINFPWPIARIVLEHHEKINGSGYPNRIHSEDILMESKVITVADVVEAMSSHRPYRPTLGIDAALGEIEKNGGVLYEQRAVDACLRLFREKRFSFESPQ